jgi:hypothetical protein
MTDITMAIDPDAAHRQWVAAFTWHLDVTPALMDALVEMTLPQIPVSRGGSRFDRLQITGGGYMDTMQILDRFDVTTDGVMVAKGAAADAQELWSWITGYTGACSAWLNQAVTAPWAADLPPVAAVSRLQGDPLTARAAALVTAGWLIDHADQIADITELEEHREEMFGLIRRLRGRYGVYNHPRRARPALCTVCGERKVVVDWVDAGNGSPKPVQAAKCKTCGAVFRESEGEAA